MDANESGREYLKALENLGTPICMKLKNIYFSDKKWPECYKEVASKFTQLKRVARKFYTDKSELEMLKEIAKYSENDLKDTYEIELDDHGKKIFVKQCGSSV